MFNSDPTIVSSFAGGVKRNGIDTGLNTPSDFPSYFALRDVFLKDAPMTRLAEVLRLDALYPHPERLVPFLGNHDTTRFMGQPGASIERLKLAFGVLATMRGMPQIYSGDEIAMEGGDDPDNRRNFPGFSGSGAFTAGGRTAEQNEMFSWVKGLLKLRTSRAELSGGEEQVLQAKGGTMLFVRGDDLKDGCAKNRPRVIVAVNNGSTTENVETSTENTSLTGCGQPEIIGGEDQSPTLNEAMLRLTIGPRRILVIAVR